MAAGAGAIIGGSGAAMLGTSAGLALIGSLFGVAGAGLTGLFFFVGGFISVYIMLTRTKYTLVTWLDIKISIYLFPRLQNEETSGAN